MYIICPPCWTVRISECIQIAHPIKYPEILKIEALQAVKRGKVFS